LLNSTSSHHILTTPTSPHLRRPRPTKKKKFFLRRRKKQEEAQGTRWKKIPKKMIEDGQRETILISDSLRGYACYMRVILILLN
jgi:hypothetical protein